MLLTKENLTATNASDLQTVTFPSDTMYQIEGNVKGLVEGEQEAAAPDMTRSGMARGHVVVLEFPSGLTLLLLMISLIFILLIIIIQELRGKKNFSC